jgi:hypothetical protein
LAKNFPFGQKIGASFYNRAFNLCAASSNAFYNVAAFESNRFCRGDWPCRDTDTSQCALGHRWRMSTAARAHSGWLRPTSEPPRPPGEFGSAIGEPLPPPVLGIWPGNRTLKNDVPSALRASIKAIWIDQSSSNSP